MRSNGTIMARAAVSAGALLVTTLAAQTPQAPADFALSTRWRPVHRRHYRYLQRDLHSAHRPRASGDHQHPTGTRGTTTSVRVGLRGGAAGVPGVIQSQNSLAANSGSSAHDHRTAVRCGAYRAVDRYGGDPARGGAAATICPRGVRLVSGSPRSPATAEAGIVLFVNEMVVERAATRCWS
jgi:hypothetical protein